MKTSIFNFNRVGLLFQRYFTERFNTELIYWIIMVIAFMFIRNVVPVMVLLIIIAGAFYASRFFREIHSKSNGVAYFMIPATQLEKMTVAVVLTSFYYFIMMLIAYTIGNLLGTFLNNMLASMDFLNGFISIFHYSPLQWKLFMNATYEINAFAFPGLSGSHLVPLFKGFLFSQSVFLLGSTYFKRNQALLTILTIFCINIFLSGLFTFEVFLLFGNHPQINNVSLNMNNTMIMHLFLYLLILFFWIVSYFRLTEKQV